MKLVLIATMLAVSVPAVAAPYSNIFVFGDSLSDRGNLAETGFLQTSAGLPVTNYPDPPSNHDSFTNGPVAVQVLAQSYGLTADPSVFVTGFKDVNGLFGGLSYVPGTNYAVAGATSAAAPAAGAQVTAGFQFDVPVRFDTDFLDVDYSAFQGGQIPKIPIIEIIP